MFEILGRMLAAPADSLTLACGACGHRTRLGRAEAIARFGSGAAPFEVRRRSVCGRCGERERIRITI